MINLNNAEFHQIMNDIQDSTLISELGAIQAAQFQATKDLNTEGHTNNPYDNVTQTLEHDAYRVMAKFLHDPDFFKL